MKIIGIPSGVWLISVLMACNSGGQSIKQSTDTEEDIKAIEQGDVEPENETDEGVDHDQSVDIPDQPVEDDPNDPMDNDPLAYERFPVAENNTLAEDKRKFMWPADGWITATNRYANGNSHSGSADISTLYWMPIMASRDGEVISVSNITTYGGWLVKLKHENGYTTLYSHLIEKASLKVGQKVRAGEVIGRVGRTGNAATAHCHFAIYKDGKKIDPPDIARGYWVRQGDFIPGTYDLPAVDSYRVKYKVKAIAGEVPIREQATQESLSTTETKLNQIYSVTSSHDGYLHLDSQEWLPMSATVPTPSHMYNVAVKTKTNVYTKPDKNSSVYATAGVGTLFTAVKSQYEGFERVLYRASGKTTVSFYYVPKTAVKESGLFRVKIARRSTNARSGPGISFKVVENLGDMWNSGSFLVYESRNGWYRIKRNGQYVWVAGWLTTGRI